MANMTIWKGPDRTNCGQVPTEIRLRDVTPQRRAKVEKLLKLLSKEKVTERADIV